MSESLNNDTIKYEKNIVEYIYVVDNKLYSKTKTIHIINNKFNIPIIGVFITEKNKENEFFLKPKLVYNDPFRVKGSSYLALCDIYDEKGEPYKNNLRQKLLSSFDNPEKINKLHPVIIFKQQYNLKYKDKKKEIEIVHNIKYLAEKHYLYCMETNMDIDGYEVKDNKVTYTIGPNSILGASDDLWMSRFILNRLVYNEEYKINYDGKLSLNYSDNDTKKESGIKVINKYFKNMGFTNSKGKIKSEFKEIFLPIQTKLLKKGSFEDRRHKSNTDPYSILKNFSKLYKN
jgi:hypothetical protein